MLAVWARIYRSGILAFILATFGLGVSFYCVYVKEKYATLKFETDKLELQNLGLKEQLLLDLRNSEQEMTYLANAPTVHQFIEKPKSKVAFSELDSLLRQLLASKQQVLSISLFADSGSSLLRAERSRDIIVYNQQKGRLGDLLGASALDLATGGKGLKTITILQTLYNPKTQTTEVVFHSAISHTSSGKRTSFALLLTYLVSPLTHRQSFQQKTINTEIHVLSPDGHRWNNSSQSNLRVNAQSPTFLMDAPPSIWKEIRQNEHLLITSDSLLLASSAIKVDQRVAGFVFHAKGPQQIEEMIAPIRVRFIWVAAFLNLIAALIFLGVQYLNGKRREAQRRLDQSLQLEQVINQLLRIKQRNLEIPAKVKQVIEVLTNFPLLHTGPDAGFFRHEDGHLNLIVDQNLDGEFKNHGHSLSLDQSLWGQIASIHEIRYVERLIPDYVLPSFTKISGYLVVPVTREEMVLGVLILSIIHPSHSSPHFEKHFFTTLAEILSAMILDDQQQKQIEFQRSKIISTSQISSLGQMAGGIAHEINNPLAIILGYSQTLENVASSLDTEDAQRIKAITDRIRKSGNRIAKIVANLREISQDGRSEEMKLVKVSEFIEKALVLLQGKISASDIKVEIKTSITDSRVLCQQAQITQVLFNVLDNAVDAVGPLKERWIHIVLSENEYQIALRVTDSGYLSPDLADKIFTPFFTTKEVGSGSGLGLSIARGIVESHGGALFLDTSSEHTSFVINLPKARVENVPIAS